MSAKTDEGLLSPSDVADIASVSRGAVSNWRKRPGLDFPLPVGGTAAKPLFSRHEVIDWLERRGHEVKQDAGETEVWAAMNLLRGELPTDVAAELVLSLAVARAFGSGVDGDLPRIDSETLARVRQAIGRVDTGGLASAVDFVLERLAKAQGKVGAEFGFVGSRTTTLLAALAATAPPGGTLYDPACGIAAALLESVSLGAKPSRVVGHDVSEQALRIAAKRAKLHEVDVELVKTDVLREDADPELRADTIILEPPFGVRLDSSARLTDARFDFGAPPRASADTAWLQHAIAHLSPTGRAYVLTPFGTLSRGGDEGRIRTELVRRGCVQAVVGLPGKMLPHVSIPLALWVLRSPVETAPSDSILFLDASDVVTPEDHVATWLQDAATREAVPHADMPVTDVLAGESVLTPQRWVDSTEREPGEVADAYTSGWATISDTVRKLNNVLASFEHFASFSKSRVMTVGDLVEQGVLGLRLGRPKDRYDGAPDEIRDRIASAADVRDGTLREVDLEGDYDSYPELTREGDVLVTTMNTICATVDDAGGHLPSTGVYRLRIRDREVLSPSYLAIALTGAWNERFQSGSTIQRASIKDLEVPLVPMTDQMNLGLAIVSIDLLKDHAQQIASQAEQVGTALLDAVRYNAPLIDTAGDPVDGAVQGAADGSDSQGAT